MIAFLKRRWFLTLLGFVLLAACIWFAGPYFAFADYHPLEPVAARVVLFVLIVGLWAIAKLIKQLRAFRASDRLLAAVVRQAPAEAQPSAEAVQLRERFEDATARLKASRRGGHSLYELPWYVIIGAPGSGKTTALINSGLKFSLEGSGGRPAIRGVGGTRNCDWWFTDEAVFLDTAGRYTTQDSEAGSDQAAWAEFLALLRKYRTRRPLNGVVLTISAHDLMTQGERARETHVEAARRRLQELNRELKIQLPVYVMVTKCDLVAGFSEYFDDLTQEGRAQVWGVTFPYDQTLDGRAVDACREEFDQLMARLNARVLARVEEERDVRRRARVFAFPQQMAALGGALTRFVGDVFGATRMDRQILLRGLYLTSGTQEGTPIDRLLGAIGRRYGVAAEAVVPPTGRGKAYFVERLLKEVLIGESGLAGVNRRLEVRKAALQLGAYAAMALIGVLGLLALSMSYARNRAYVDEVAQELAKLASVPPLASAVSPQALLPRLDVIRAIVDVANRHREDPPLTMRWGLFQGTSLGNAARDAYVRELDATLLPRVAGRIEERLVEYAAQPEKLYEYLKAYVMLGEPRYMKKEHLEFIASLEWRAADNADPDSAQRLSAHFDSLLDYGDTLRPIGTNSRLLTQARSSLGSASIPQIIYARLKREYQEDRSRAVRLDLAAGVGVEGVLRRRSGISLAEPIPSFYSRGVFQEVTSKQAPELVRAFAAEDWVWGDGGSAGRTSGRLSAEVTDLYEREYIKTWDEVLADLELVPFATTAQGLDALERLAGPTSPLRGVLQAVVDHTSLVEEPAPDPAQGAADAAKKSITDRLGGKAVTDRLGSLFGGGKDGSPTRRPGVVVAAHFQQVHQLLAGEPGNTALDRILMRIGQVQHMLRSMDPAARLETLSSPELRDVLRSLRQEAEVLPPVLQDVVTQVGSRVEHTAVSGATAELERRYVDQVQRECSQLLAGRYPFVPTSQVDLPLSDFARLFGYGGTFDKFFAENLAPLVDTTQTPWRWRSGVAGPGGILDLFERARQIRALFFKAGSSALEVPFHITIAEIDQATIRFILDLDGQPYEYRPPIRPYFARWPGPNPAGSGVIWHERYGATPRVSFTGPWAWFRLLDAAEETRVSDVRTTLVFAADRHRARLIIEAGSILNPLIDRRWQQFSCGS